MSNATKTTDALVGRDALSTWWGGSTELPCPAAEQKSDPVSFAINGMVATTIRVCAHMFSNATLRASVVGATEQTESVSEEARQVTLKVLRDLQSVPSDDLTYGTRMEVMHSLFSDAPGAKGALFCDALSRAILTDQKCLSDEAKDAAIRYFGIYESPLRTSELSKMFFSILDAGSEEVAISAARSLGDIGNLGTIPALTSAMRKREGTGVAREVRRAIRRIEDSHGVNPHP